MELEQLRKQLLHLDQGQIEILRRINEMAEDLKNTMVEIGGVPDEIGRDPHRLSIRRRLHDLEGDREAVRIAAQAVQVATRARDDATKAREDASMTGFTKRQTIAGLIIAAVVAVGPYIAPLFH